LGPAGWVPHRSKGPAGLAGAGASSLSGRASVTRAKASEPAIRAAEEVDAAAIAAIYAPYVEKTAVSFEIDPPTAEIMAQRIAGSLETHPWLVADRGGEVVGYAYAGKHRERAAYRWTVDTTIYVDPAARQQGIGRALYRVLLDMLRWQGFRSAFAEIVLPNPGSVRLHENAGFKHVGVHKDIGFKLGRWHDIGYWRMGLTDTAAPPSEPVPFATFRQTSGFAVARGQISEFKLIQYSTVRCGVR
jgi:L-amino acid N-acyltransferase YncA